MDATLYKLLIFTSIPAICMAIGGIIALIKQPGPRTTSTVQHFAAGVVIAAVAIELLPKIVNQNKWYLSIGFIVGVIFMISVDKITHAIQHKNESQSTSAIPLGLITAVGVDVFIDGLLIGVSFLASVRSGIVIAGALTLEVLFLGLATSASLGKKSVSKFAGMCIIILLAVLIPMGAFIGFSVVSRLSSDAHYMIMAFGVAALLYLVTEELLTEAHEEKETVIATSAFFVGFLVILLVS